MKSNKGFKARDAEPDMKLYSIDVAKIREGDIRLTLRTATDGPPYKYTSLRVEMDRKEAMHLASIIVTNLV